MGQPLVPVILPANLVIACKDPSTSESKLLEIFEWDWFEVSFVTCWVDFGLVLFGGETDAEHDKKNLY